MGGVSESSWSGLTFFLRFQNRKPAIVKTRTARKLTPRVWPEEFPCEELAVPGWLAFVSCVRVEWEPLPLVPAFKEIWLCKSPWERLGTLAVLGSFGWLGLTGWLALAGTLFWDKLTPGVLGAPGVFGVLGVLGWFGAAGEA